MELLMKNNTYYINEVKYNVKKNMILEDYDLIKINISNDYKKNDYKKLWENLKKNIDVISYYRSKNNIFLLLNKNKIYDLKENELLKLNIDIKLIDSVSINSVP